MNKIKKSFSRLSMLLLFMFLLTGVFSGAATAATAATATAATINVDSCKLTSKTQVRVEATCPDISQVSGGTVYLFCLPDGTSSIPAGKSPVATSGVASRMSFTVTQSQSWMRTATQYEFVLADMYHGSYRIISEEAYISNPSVFAAYKSAFPTAVSKKGLQISGDMMEDVQELGVKHSVINIVFTEFIAAQGERSKTYSIPYKYSGKTYWYRKSRIGDYDAMLKKLKTNNTVVSAVMLLGYRGDLLHLISPEGRVPGKNFYAWNVYNTSARQELEAAVSFLANRYGTGKGKNGTIVNWIVGNEVDEPIWNYAGNISFTSYMKLYAGAYRMVYNAVTSVYKNARVYISLDYYWSRHAGGYAGREVLKAFANSMRDLSWNVAYHPYNSPLSDPELWNNKNGTVKQNYDTPVVTMANLNVLTDFIRNNYGSTHRVILSEVGFTSAVNKVRYTSQQAASIAYAYYLTESNSMVDSFIMNRQVDHILEKQGGLACGLWNSVGMSTASTKKPSWEVFKFMDTTDSEKYTSSSLKVIGAKSWNELVPGFSKQTYSKSTVKKLQLKTVKRYAIRSKLAGRWNVYGAYTGTIRKKRNALTVKHLNGANRNRPFGIVQTFSNTKGLSKYPIFAATINARGSKNNKAKVQIRFISGNEVYECVQNIKCGKNIKLGVSLKNWKLRSKIRRIEVTVLSEAGWKNGASVTIDQIGCTK